MYLYFFAYFRRLHIIKAATVHLPGRLFVCCFPYLTVCLTVIVRKTSESVYRREVEERNESDRSHYQQETYLGFGWQEVWEIWKLKYSYTVPSVLCDATCPLFSYLLSIHCSAVSEQLQWIVWSVWCLHVRRQMHTACASALLSDVSFLELRQNH